MQRLNAHHRRLCRIRAGLRDEPNRPGIGRAAIFGIIASLVLMASPALGWTPSTIETVGQQAARLAPPDLYRQLVKNHASYDVGLQDPFHRGDPEDRYADPDGSGRLDEALRIAVDHAIAAIREPRPFNEIAYRLGVVAHYVALVNDPLATAASDAQEARYRADFARYAESASQRIQLVFYGFRPQVGKRQVEAVVADALRRSRSLYPMVGREYRRVGFQSGVQVFDDRSTAYAVAALGQSHAISDIAEVLRYIWLRAGGIDSRDRVPLRGHSIVRLDPLDAPSGSPSPRSRAGR